MIIEFNDHDRIKRILYDDEMWARISEDGQKKELDTEIEGFDWYGLIKNGDLTGLLLIHPVLRHTAHCHIHILQQYRDLSYEVGCEIMNMLSKLKWRKYVTQIPVIYQDVYHFVKKFNWQDEGTNRKSIMKNGHLIDQYYLGITKDEVTQWVQQRQ